MVNMAFPSLARISRSCTTALRRLRGRQTLAREITAILVAKALLLMGGYWAFFGPQTRPDLAPTHVHDHLAPAAAQPANSALSTLVSAEERQ